MEGPRRSSSSTSRNWARAPARSNGVSSRAARHRLSARSKASRPTASLVYSTTTWNTPASRVAAVRLKVTGHPASACSPRAAASRAWARESCSAWLVDCREPISGKRARKRASNSPRPAREHSASLQVTMASIAVCRLHRLGPRRARIRDTSMNTFSCCTWLARLGSQLG
ncbi:hypothetical protein SDC9_176180 [bioreactor metagenome]|uniref:Uncharacterized protein n=1 Tax=bioreactor metagenome TaxID=1076179 RepID=A0A645GPY7_9ZZZZ